MDENKAVLKAREMIEDSKNPIMFFDTDSDGCSSFLQLRRLRDFKGYPLGKDDDFQNEAMSQIREEHDLIIFFDTPHIKSEFFDIIVKLPVLWVDHHIFNKEKISQLQKRNENLFFLNPLNFSNKDSRSSAYWMHRICDDKRNLPYAVLGSLGDFYLLDIIIDLYEYDREVFDLMFEIDDSKKEELFDFIRKYSFDDMRVVSSRRKWIQYLWYDCNFIRFKMFFDILFKSFKPQIAMLAVEEISKMNFVDFKTNLVNGKTGVFEKFSQLYSEFRDVYSKILKEISGKSESLVFVTHSNTSVSFNRQISEELSYRVKDFKVIVCAYFKDSKNFVSFSFRSKGDVDVNDLVRECGKGLKFQGGGHIASSGCIVYKKDYDEFVRRIKDKFE